MDVRHSKDSISSLEATKKIVSCSNKFYLAAYLWVSDAAELFAYYRDYANNDVWFLGKVYVLFI